MNLSSQGEHAHRTQGHVFQETRHLVCVLDAGLGSVGLRTEIRSETVEAVTERVGPERE